MDASLLSTPSVEMSRIEVSRRTVAAWAAGIRAITLLAMPSLLSHFRGEATSKTNGGTSEAWRKSRPASLETTVVSSERGAVERNTNGRVQWKGGENHRAGDGGRSRALFRDGTRDRRPCCEPRP